MSDPNDFLLGSGGASFSWKEKPLGTTIEGTIARAPEVRQQTDLQTGNPLTWDNGDPKMQLVVALQTTLREDDDDDGVRNLYVKGSKKPESKSLHAAVAGAVQAARAKGLEVGGHLKVTLTGKRPSTTKGFNDANEFAAVYTPASASYFEATASGGQITTDPAPPGFTQQQWDSFNDVQKAALRNVPTAAGTDGPPF
jgi:hypothetical protein